MPKPEKMSPDVAATKIIALFRGIFERKKYRTRPLSAKYQTNYPLFIRGNDPEISDIPMPAKNEKFVLISTSGFRSVQLACELGGSNAKIILIDNSSTVTTFWKKSQKIISQVDCKEEFIEFTTQTFLESTVLFDFPAGNHDAQNYDGFITYFTDLCDVFGFSTVKKIISGASISTQNWENEETVTAIKNIVHYHNYDKVYVYVSNIVTYLLMYDKVEEALNLLSNIALLNPDIAIHTSRNEFFFTQKEEHHDCELVLNTIEILALPCEHQSEFAANIVKNIKLAKQQYHDFERDESSASTSSSQVFKAREDEPKETGNCSFRM